MLQMFWSLWHCQAKDNYNLGERNQKITLSINQLVLPCPASRHFEVVLDAILGHPYTKATHPAASFREILIVNDSNDSEGGDEENYAWWVTCTIIDEGADGS